MENINFPQANDSLLGGTAAKYNTEEDVTDLRVSKTGSEIISCWKASWRERLSILFYGKVWLRVAAIETHSPVSIETVDPWEGVG